MGEIKKQFRKLSIQFHPDKQGGNQEMFMKIAKAHEAYVYSGLPHFRGPDKRGCLISGVLIRGVSLISGVLIRGVSLILAVLIRGMASFQGS